nr:EOG090X0ARU [Sida crystallina]
MFKRKLTALGYPNPDSFNIADEAQMQNLVVWLEDQKIRRYKIEEREELRNSKAEAWTKAYQQYLIDLDCPAESGSRNEIVDWLLSLGVHFEFSEKPDLYSNKAEEPTKSPITIKANPLDNLDFESNDFKLGVNALADILHVAHHPDHLMTLEAVCSIIKERFNAESLKDPSKFPASGTPLQFEACELGMDLKEANLNQAAKILRYLFIHDLRDLQTKINECIVAVQALTANPKTDTKLGKVGY